MILVASLLFIAFILILLYPSGPKCPKCGNYKTVHLKSHSGSDDYEIKYCFDCKHKWDMVAPDDFEIGEE